MKKTIIICLGIMCVLGCQKIDQKQAEIKAVALLEKTVRKNDSLNYGQLLVHSGRFGIYWNKAIGHLGREHNKAILIQQPFHVASIGKTFTAVLIARLQEAGKLDYNDSIVKYLSDEQLKGLYEFEGQDYADQARIKQLLNHTSGIADYFEDKAKNHKAIKELILDDPERFWTPTDLIDFTRNYQKCVGRPGQEFHYSDTGYILLGLLIENVTGKPFHENLHDEIFNPLNMDDSYLLFYSKPKNPKAMPMANTIFNEVDVTHYKSLSIDWAGGGIVSTMEDLLKFQKAIHNETLIKMNTLNMIPYQHDFTKGIKYGNGLMRVNYGDMIFLLKGLPILIGNCGSIGTLMFYVPDLDMHIIANFGNSAFVEGGFQFLAKLLMMLKNVEKPAG
ncbi:beta-lactamase family protein [bacterium]|nr:beta-lactamase family protein [bacterium]